jgi:hypothetical protein
VEAHAGWIEAAGAMHTVPTTVGTGSIRLGLPDQQIALHYLSPFGTAVVADLNPLPITMSMGKTSNNGQDERKPGQSQGHPRSPSSQDRRSSIPALPRGPGGR